MHVSLFFRSEIRLSVFSSYSYQYGLWKAQYCLPDCKEYQYSCDTTGSSSVTTVTSDRCSRLLAGRAFMTLACILTPLALILLVIILVLKKFQRPFLSIMKVLNASCCLIGLIGTIIGSVATLGIVDTSGSDSLTTSTGIGLSIVAVVTNFIGLIISAFVREGSPAV